MAHYFDYAAATPLDPSVLAVMQPYFSEQFYNPSAIYRPAVEVSKAIEAARSDIAAILGAKSTEIIFTAGGTEANNTAIHGVMHRYPEARIAFSAIEHDSVRVPAGQYAHDVIPVNEQGIIDPEHLGMTDQTVLVSVMYANNEVGTIQPIKRIAAVIDETRRERLRAGNTLPLYFHIDAAQAGNYLDLHVHRLGVDMMTINGGKLYGPKQSGALFIKTGVSLEPLITGGGQERNIRSGTENVAAVIGLAAALKHSQALRESESQRLHDLQQAFIEQLKTAFPECIINGSLKYRLPNNVHITIPRTDNERVLMALDMHDIYAAAGSACSASHDEPSHVLAAMGLDVNAIQSSLRFSMGRQTTNTDIEHVVKTLTQIMVA